MQYFIKYLYKGAVVSVTEISADVVAEGWANDNPPNPPGNWDKWLLQTQCEQCSS